MKQSILFPILTLLLFSISFVSCDDDDNGEDTNMITITIEEPVDGEELPFAECDDVHIHVDFEASIENHEVEIVLHPEGDVDDRIIDYDEHSHDKEIIFEQEVDLCSYGEGACFHLEVQACLDHDCEETVIAEAEFCID